ncbi:MAG: hemerythrin domain-containing protein, partial [Candidatus Neomarinimicrobiota bacterium]
YKQRGIMTSANNNRTYSDSGRKILESLDRSHVIYTMVIEHQLILEILSSLGQARKELKTITEKDMDAERAKTILTLAHKVIGAETHHLREEQALFPKMREFGISGPANVMEMEHKAIRDYKRKLLKSAQEYENTPFKDYQSHLDFFIGGLTQMLADHIHKENDILYPMALNTLSDPEIWLDMRKKCDAIGYCSFTPGFGIELGKSDS